MVDDPTCVETTHLGRIPKQFVPRAVLPSQCCVLNDQLYNGGQKSNWPLRCTWLLKLALASVTHSRGTSIQSITYYHLGSITNIPVRYNPMPHRLTHHRLLTSIRDVPGGQQTLGIAGIRWPVMSAVIKSKMLLITNSKMVSNQKYWSKQHAHAQSCTHPTQQKAAIICLGDHHERPSMPASHRFTSIEIC